MGYFRFRKTFSVLPGVKINLSKTGVSTSLGGKGATLNVGHGKQNVTLGIPGTGLSYRTAGQHAAGDRWQWSSSSSSASPI